jgi:hypothetical protein
MVADHWPDFRERVEAEAGALPKFIVEELEAYLRCGILDHGCLHLVCRDCGHSEVVAFSCKMRGFCPSCMGRRMVDTAVHLEESVLPAVPVRHWICSFPWGLRALLGYDRVLCAEVVSAFVGELTRSLRKRAKRALGLRSISDVHTGAVAAVQRTDSALRLNVHLHVLALDGVYTPDGKDGDLVFHALPAPTSAEMTEVARRTACRVDKILRKHGRSLDGQQHDAPAELTNDPALAACYAAAAQGISISGNRAGQPTLRLVLPSNPPAGSTTTEEPVAEVRGINLHAKQVVDGRDRRQLERLCRYITRPPLAQDRLSRRADGSLLLTLKSPWKDGTRALILEPQDLLTRLVAAIPPPRFHMVRYFGVLSSHSKLRSRVVPTPKEDPSRYQAPPAPGDQLELGVVRNDNDEKKPAGRKRWAWLLRHVFAEDLDTCPRCGGAMRWAEVATTPEAIARLITQHGIPTRSPPTPRPTVPRGQLRLPFKK